MLGLRYALRTLLRAPGFTVAVVLTLGLGIGANTAIFSVVHAVLLRPLPNRDGDRLIYLKQYAERGGGDNVAFSVPEINDFREASKSLGGIAEFSPIAFTLVENEGASKVDVGLVTGNYFSVMGLAPVAGRAFTSGDDGPTAAPVVMLGYEFWQKKFSGDPAIVGKTLRINGRAVPVVGVLQAAPAFPNRTDLLMNMVASEHHISATMVTGRTHRMTEMIARLAPDASLQSARTEVATIIDRVHRQYPDAYDAASGYTVSLTPLHDTLGERARLTLWLLMGAAAFVLVIACANVANLALMRGVKREHEFTVRAALGAGTSRLRTLLLAENLLLALAGGALGLAIAYGGVGLLTRFAERYSPRASEIRVDGVVLAFALTLCMIIALVLAFAPKISREGEIGESLASGGKRGQGGTRRKRVQGALVVTQLATSVVLLTGAFLLIRTMQQLAAVDDGLDAEQALTMEVQFDFNQDNVETAMSKFEQMKTELGALSGVSTVGYGSVMPLRTAGFMLDLKAENRPLASGEPIPRAEFRTASPEYFKASGIPLVKGRGIETTDRAGGTRVVVLNQSLADRLFPGRDPLGRRIAWTGDVLKFIPVVADWRTVVGVVGDTKDGGLDSEPTPAVFMPFAQEAFPTGGVVIRANADAAALASSATSIVRRIVPQQPVERVLTVTQIRDESVGPRRLNALLVSAFGVLALVVAAIGIAAVLSFSVAARINEIGIRMSLGADAGRIQRMIIGEGGALVAIGLGLGVVLALGLSQLVQGVLFGVAPYDPIAIVTTVVTMAAVGVLACWVPARRASRIDPATAIRAN